MVIGKINFLHRFIANLLGKMQACSPLLKLKNQDQFVWEKKHQHAFEQIKRYLTNPPVLMPPKSGRPLKLYLSATDNTIGSMLT